uniref:DUF6533 domain-containing protein n=1 Tax=Mycena chlorophos TaxID=658473 RepID=A0ABQ0L2Q7_MYCCL|nr:predicted protein [Mycena chlorophos]
MHISTPVVRAAAPSHAASNHDSDPYSIAYTLAVVVSDSRHTNYLAVASFTVLLLDLLSNVEDEIKLVWNRPWTLPSVLHTQSIATTLLFGSFNLMLMLRVWILYGRTRRIAYFFFPVLFIEVALMLVLILRPISYVHEFIHVGPALQGCYFSSTVMDNMKFALYAVPPLTITAIMFYLTVKKCIETLRLERIPTGRNFRGSFVDKPIITLFLRDGIVWFVVVFTFHGTDVILWSVGRSTQFQVLIIPSLAQVSSSLSCVPNTEIPADYSPSYRPASC